MRSSLPKVLHRVADRALLSHAMHAAMDAGSDAIAVVVGNGSDKVETEAKNTFPDAAIYLQTERLGTAHAVLSAREALDGSQDDILIIFGDTPLLKPETLLMMRKLLADGATVAALGFRTNTPDGYGRFIEDNGSLVRIVEHKDASDDERKIGFCNGGIMAISGKHALKLLEKVGNDNANSEYYLPDVVAIAHAEGLEVVAAEAPEEELMGVNNRAELAIAERLWQQNKRNELLLSGVTMIAPETVYLSADTEIEADVTLEPNIVFGQNVKIASGTRIKAFCHIEGANIGANADIGPYARLRPGSVLHENAKVGNFVETKKAEIHAGAKVNHLTYIGDAQVGAAANIGAGTITCNYDGMNKHLTEIGEGAFVGSNSSLVAPVKIGKGAYVASGSVITEDIPEDAMGVARGIQTNKSGYASRIRDRNAALKKRRSE